jgi:DNA-binding NarL/FixJ family response regulator
MRNARTEIFLSVPNLTKREAEILHLLAQGFNNRQIARSILVSRETVKLDLKHIYRKLEVTNRVQAAIKHLRQGSL